MNYSIYSLELLKEEEDINYFYLNYTDYFED